MIKLEMVEFYITNVCNLTCHGCNRFNNYHFTGHQIWSEHEQEYEKWAEKLDLDLIVLMGGEPTLSPELETYVKNIRRLWPDSKIMIQTNGTYPRVGQRINDLHMDNLGFCVSIHEESMANDLKSNYPSGYLLEQTHFTDAAIIKKNDHFEVHNSNVTRAFNSCAMKHSHTLFNGMLYKCPTMVTLPEFQKQFDLRLTTDQQTLLESYKPLNADCSDEDLFTFLTTRDSSIPQCQFCPSGHVYHLALTTPDK